MGDRKQVNPPVAAEPIPDPPVESAQGTAGRDGLRENWLDHHINTIAIAIVAAGFGFRVYLATQSYLNPDEALHYILTNQRSLWLAYKASLTNAHPPLMYIILYYWHFLGRSEWMLRLPWVVLGTAFCWVLYKWIGIVFGRTAGMIGLILAAFSPALVALSAEVRQYAVLLFCMSCALYFLERAYEDKSVRKMWAFSGFLYLAILSHYSAVFFTVAVGVYALARLVDSRPPWKLAVAWAGGQAVALGIYIVLYVTHVSKIKKADMATWESPFASVGAFFHFGHESLLRFTGKQTLSVFQFQFEQDYIAMAMFLFFVAGVTVLLARDLIFPRKGPRTWHLGVLLLLPFVAVWGAALAGVYPYVGGRHTVFLAPFVIAGVSYLLASILGRKPWAVALIAALIVVGAYTSGKTYEPYIKKENQKRSLMTGAMAYIRQTVPKGDVILVDSQSDPPIVYYLCGPADIIQIETYRRAFGEFRCSGYSIISTSYRVWKLTPQNFSSQFEKMASAHGMMPGTRVWVFQTGWGANLDAELSWDVLKFRCMASKSFGENITVIPFQVGPDLSPALPPGSQHLNSLGRCSG